MAPTRWTPHTWPNPCAPVGRCPGVGYTGSLPGAAGAAMSWFSRMRGNSHSQLETPEDEKYPEGKGGVIKAVTADFVLNKDEKLGIHLTDNNIISKIDAGSIAERDAKFKVGDTIVAVNGESCDGLEVAEMIRDMDTVSLTATRKRNSVKVPVRPPGPVDHAWSVSTASLMFCLAPAHRCTNRRRPAQSRGPQTTPTRMARRRGDKRRSRSAPSGSLVQLVCRVQRGAVQVRHERHTNGSVHGVVYPM